MLRLLLVAVACIASASTSLAQKVGDTADVVESLLGRAPMVRTTSQGEIWLYPEGARVTFKSGVVTAIDGFEAGVPVEQASNRITVIPEPAPARVAPPERHARADPLLVNPQTGEPSRLGWVLILVAGVIVTVCKLLILVRAFKESVAWGLGSMFIPGVSLLYILFHWSDVKGPVLVNLATLATFLVIAFQQGLLNGV